MLSSSCEVRNVSMLHAMLTDKGNFLLSLSTSTINLAALRILWEFGHSHEDGLTECSFLLSEHP